MGTGTIAPLKKGFVNEWPRGLTDSLFRKTIAVAHARKKWAVAFSHASGPVIRSSFKCISLGIKKCDARGKGDIVASYIIGIVV